MPRYIFMDGDGDGDGDDDGDNDVYFEEDGGGDGGDHVGGFNWIEYSVF